MVRPNNPTENGTERYVHDEPCDGPECSTTPTAYVGDIYYACEKHYPRFKELI